MSTTARKTRKRMNNRLRAAGVEPARFQHPVKVLTPIHERVENQSTFRMNPDGTVKTGRTSKARRRLDEHLAAQATGRLSALDELPLDPKPYIVGRKRFATEAEAQAQAEIDRNGYRLSPRKTYVQDVSAYSA